MSAAKNKPSLEVTQDFTKEFEAVILKFKSDRVLVGIPMADTQRTAVEGEKEVMNNAAILAINEFGSEAAGIPPRPVMSIGIRNAQDAIAEQFKKAAQNALSKGLAALDQYYERAGIIASTSVKKAINAQDGIEKPSDATLAARKAKGFKGIKALIVTGQLRNAITYVVKKGL